MFAKTFSIPLLRVVHPLSLPTFSTMGLFTRFSVPSNCRPIPPEEAAELVAEKTAVLIDLREPDEWAGTGVATPAILLSLSEFGRPENQELLESHRAQELIFYCHSGSRSGRVARDLAQQGYRTANMGGFAAWEAAGLPVRQV